MSYRWGDVNMKASRFDYTELEDGTILYERYFIFEDGGREYYSDIMQPDQVPNITQCASYAKKRLATN